jgi:hypothetical protein
MSGFKSSLPSDENTTGNPLRDEPIGLTVHTMPHLDKGAVRQAGNTPAAKIKLLLLLLVTVAPVIASYFTYYVVRPEGRRNYGELIDPQPEMPNVVGVDLQGRQVALSALKDQWLLISVGDSACGEGCEKHLYLSRQLRESLGKDKERVDWVWLRTGAADIPSRLLPGLSTAKVLKFESAELAAWLRPAEGRQLTDHLYLVDPMGHWMMRFPADADPVKVRKDLERLMRGASSWDKEGRP